MANTLKNIWENLWFQAKCFFKSHDLSQRIQIILMILPFLLGWISLAFVVPKIIDFIAFFFSILALVYYIWYWRYAELYMEIWEKYMVLYHDIEMYFKTAKNYSVTKVKYFTDSSNSINNSKKPPIHWWAKSRVDRIIDKEMKYWNQKKVWRK